MANVPIGPRVVFALDRQLGRVNEVSHLRIFEAAQMVAHVSVGLRARKNVLVSLAGEKDILRERYSTGKWIAWPRRWTDHIQQAPTLHLIVSERTLMDSQ